MKTSMLCIVLVVCLLAPAMAERDNLKWGPVGHAVTAQIAAGLLDSATVSKCESILGGATLPSIASWADQVKHTAGWEWSAPLHFINTPAWSCDFEYPRDCADNICVAGAIKNYTKRLATVDDPDEQAIALKFLVHFAGDIHQPLHCGFGVDKGGNTITGTFFGYNDNLHEIWDTYIIYDRIHNDFSGNQDDWFNYLMTQISGAWSSKVKQWQTCSANETYGACPDDWGNGSAGLACTYAYTDSTGQHIQSGFNLGDPYFQFTKNIVDEQLAKGGVRLAKMLKAIISGDNSPLEIPQKFTPASSEARTRLGKLIASALH